MHKIFSSAVLISRLTVKIYISRLSYNDSAMSIANSWQLCTFTQSWAPAAFFPWRGKLGGLGM